MTIIQIRELAMKISKGMGYEIYLGQGMGHVNYLGKGRGHENYLGKGWGHEMVSQAKKGL